MAQTAYTSQDLANTLDALTSSQTIAASGTAAGLVVTDSGSNANSVKIAPSANKSASVSVGGALLVESTNSTGAGIVVTSNNAAPSGRLLVVNAQNAAFNQAALHVQHAGTAAAINVVQSNTSPTVSALNITFAGGNGSSTAHAIAASVSNSGNANCAAMSLTSLNTANSCVWITGSELSRGTVKIAHVGDAGGLDSNASAISIDLQTAGTASQGIFMDSTNGASTGNMLELRSNGTTRLRLTPSGNLMISAPNAAPASTSPPMFNGSVTLWLDEAGNNVKFQCRYSSGTVKTGTLAVV